MTTEFPKDEAADEAEDKDELGDLEASDSESEDVKGGMIKSSIDKIIVR